MSNRIKKINKLKPIHLFLLTIIFFTCAYGYYQYDKMQKKLRYRLENDANIISITGKVISLESISSKSDCAHVGACSTSSHIYKVQGEEKCVYVRARLKESFPVYRVLSVAPMTYGLTDGLSGDYSERVRGCD